jgi:hypothetical protein
MLAKFKEKEVSKLRLGFQEIVEEGLKLGGNPSEYSSNRKSDVNDEGHEECDTANDDILCITWPLFCIIHSRSHHHFLYLILHYPFFTKLIAR